jgi:hypothetical protein
MKTQCLITGILALLVNDVQSTSSVTQHGLLRHGLKLRTQPVAAANQAQLVEDRVSDHLEAAKEPGRTWIKITNVAEIWPDTSTVPRILQYIFTFSWILMIASLPFALPLLDRNPVTRTQKVVGALMLVVLFGGLYLFTNVILFQSGHFKQTRPLTMIECIYFMSQVITTVGYGDITPAKTRGQVFVALYVLGALFVIAMLVSQLIDHCTQLLHQQRQKMWGLTPRGKDDKINTTTLHDLLAPERPSMWPLLRSFAVFAILDILWIAFYASFPGENKTVFQAFYMSLITLTTVGFGAITPLTEGGMIFAAFFMLVGSANLVNVISNFVEFVSMMNEYQRFSPEIKREAVNDLRGALKDKDKVSELEFLRFVVQYEGLMTEAESQCICEVFKSLKPQDGILDFKTVENAMEVERQRPKYFDTSIL